jgi:hypothetical protein
MVVVKTARGLTTRVRFLPVMLTSLGSKEWNPLLLNYRNNVNTIMRFCESSSGTDAFRRGRRNVHARPRALPRNKRYPKRLGRVSNRYHRAGYNRSAVSDRKKSYQLGETTAWAEARDAALVMALLWVWASAWQLPLPWPLAWRSLSE